MTLRVYYHRMVPNPQPGDSRRALPTGLRGQPPEGKAMSVLACHSFCTALQPSRKRPAPGGGPHGLGPASGPAWPAGLAYHPLFRSLRPGALGAHRNSPLAGPSPPGPMRGPAVGFVGWETEGAMGSSSARVPGRPYRTANTGPASEQRPREGLGILSQGAGVLATGLTFLLVS